MTQDFGTQELKEALERSLGFALRPLERLGGAAAVNFKAVRDSDGLTFAVKCSPPSGQVLFDRLVEHLETLKGTKAVMRVFERECPSTFRGYNLLCTAWCFGERVFPDRMTDGQLDGFLEDYLAFSAAMQNVKTFESERPIPQWRQEALGKCRGLPGAIMRGLVAALRPDDCSYRPGLLRVIHGDLHHGNLLFAGGRVDRYLDLEEFRMGYPADDLVRYFVCAAEHLRWYAWRRRRRTLHAFAHAVRRLRYSRHEWMFAVNACFISKLHIQTGAAPRFTIWHALNLAWRARFYREMRSVVEGALGGPDT